jgi:hypothetical protein
MKKLNSIWQIIFILVFAIALTQCEKNDNDGSPDDNNNNTETPLLTVFSFKYDKNPSAISYNLNGEIGSDKVVTVQFPTDADVGSLIATFTLAEGAEARINDVLQESGVTSNDFSTDVVYEVTKGDVIQTYTVKLDKKSGGVSIASFILKKVDNPGFKNMHDLEFAVINPAGNAGGNVASIEQVVADEGVMLKPTITFTSESEGATVQFYPSAGDALEKIHAIAADENGAYDFKVAKAFTVSSELGTMAIFTVSIKWRVIGDGKLISFSFDAANNSQLTEDITAYIDDSGVMCGSSGNCVILTMPQGIDVTQLIPTFYLTSGSSWLLNGGSGEYYRATSEETVFDFAPQNLNRLFVSLNDTSDIDDVYDIHLEFE